LLRRGGANDKQYGKKESKESSKESSKKGKEASIVFSHF